LGRGLKYFVEENKFEKKTLEMNIMDWMPSKVGQAFTLFDMITLLEIGD